MTVYQQEAWRILNAISDDRNNDKDKDKLADAIALDLEVEFIPRPSEVRPKIAATPVLRMEGR